MRQSCQQTSPPSPHPASHLTSSSVFQSMCSRPTLSISLELQTWRLIGFAVTLFCLDLTPSGDCCVRSFHIALYSLPRSCFDGWLDSVLSVPERKALLCNLRSTPPLATTCASSFPRCHARVVEALAEDIFPACFPAAAPSGGVANAACSPRCRQALETSAQSLDCCISSFEWLSSSRSRVMPSLQYCPNAAPATLVQPLTALSALFGVCSVPLKPHCDSEGDPAASF